MQINYAKRVCKNSNMAFHECPNLKKVFFILILVILLVTIKLFDSVSNPKENEIQQLSDDFLKVFHLDLKGGAPKLRFLLNVLPLIRMSGANAILIEYEDMFPFSGSLKNISAGNAYSLAEVNKLIEVAETLKMEVIPLVQTFGHLEYVLKLEEFRSLRELDGFPQEICPMNKQAVDVVKEIIRQCMAVHSKSRYIHIGCDEVRHIGACSRCSRNNSKKLFANHVVRIAEFIKSEYSGVTPLIWDDMLRDWTFRDLTNSGLGSVVEPVVWVYGEDVFSTVPFFLWNIYQKTFPRVWGASAFKGAFGETEILPDLKRHLENNLSWMKVIMREDDETSLYKEMAGIILTGWSRYDHFATLCELLPVGIPSLVLSLTFLDPRFNGKLLEGVNEWLRILRCPPNYFPSDLKNEPFFQYKLRDCSFPGSNLYFAMTKLKKLRARVKEVTNKVETSGWTSKYNLEKNFSNPWQLSEMFPSEGFAGEILRKEISVWKSDYLPVLEQYFDQHMILEWEEQNVKSLEDKLAEIRDKFQKVIEKKSWPKRPLR